MGEQGKLRNKEQTILSELLSWLPQCKTFPQSYGDLWGILENALIIFPLKDVKLWTMLFLCLLDWGLPRDIRFSTLWRLSELPWLWRKSWGRNTEKCSGCLTRWAFRELGTVPHRADQNRPAKWGTWHLLHGSNWISQLFSATIVFDKCPKKIQCSSGSLQFNPSHLGPYG